MKVGLQAAGIFALLAFGCLCLRLADVIPNGLEAIGTDIHNSLGHIDAAVTDLDRVSLIAGGVLNEARQIERDNRKDIAAANKKTLDTLSHVDRLVGDLDDSQKQVAQSVQQTTEALKPVILYAAQDAHDLDPVIVQTAGIAANLNSTTADVAAEVHKLVFPPPRKWWQKYLVDPLKIAAHVVSIPLGHL